MSNTKNFVIDTNVLLNDPQCILQFGKNNVYIPFVVLEEIDNFKKGNSSLSSAARSVSRILDDLRDKGRFSNGVELDSGGQLVVPDMSPMIESGGQNSGMENDSIILKTCLDLDEEKDNVVLITEDINLRVRGSALGIDAQKHEASRVEDTSFYDSASKYMVPRKTVDDLWDKNEAFAEDLRQEGIQPEENEYFVLQEHSGSTSAMACYRDGKIRSVKERDVYGISGRNKEQHFALDALMNNDIKLVVLAGKAGCGKTLLSLAAGLEQVTERDNYNKLTVSRPNISMGKDLGYLPGDLEEKLDPWMAPIWDNLDFLYNNPQEKNGYSVKDYLTEDGTLEVTALSYIRGRSLSDQFVLIDEAQNLSSHEIKTIVTRIGDGSKLVVTGDPYQIDNPYLDHDSNALSYLIDRMQDEEIFSSVVLTEGERSELAEIAAQKL